MNRREFVRAALLAGAGAACGVRAASPAPDPGALQLAMWGKLTGRPVVLSEYAPESYREALRTNETWVPKKLSCPMPWYDELEHH